MSVQLDHLHCPCCGYALRGLPDHICPECGSRFDPDALQKASLEPLPRSIVTWAATALIVGAGSVPATIVIGLEAVRFQGCWGCCRPASRISEEFAIMLVLALILLGPSVAVLGVFLERLQPSVLTRITIVGMLAAATAWTTLLVLLSMAR